MAKSAGEGAPYSTDKRHTESISTSSGGRVETEPPQATMKQMESQDTCLSGKTTGAENNGGSAEGGCGR